MKRSFLNFAQIKTILTIGKIFFSALLFFCASLASAQTSTRPLPDYSDHSPEQIDALIQNGDMHAVFTKAYNLIFDFDSNLRDTPDFDTAIPLLEQAHNGGHDTANSILALYYYGELGDGQDIEKADKIAIQASENGSGIAQLNYGLRYIDSDVDEKSNRAFDYLKKAAENSDVNEHAFPELLKNLYGMFSDRRRDYAEARKWALKCAKALPDNAHCQYLLGRDYENGWGGETDKSKSVEHYLKSAALGDARAQWQVGMYYLNGDGVEKNEYLAFEWVNKAADQDYLNGLISLAVMHAIGQGTKIDHGLSFETYERAARQGSGHAIRGIGAMYCSGEAPVTDKDLCAAGLIIAYELGDELAGNLLNHFFKVTNGEEFRILRDKTTTAQAELIEKYQIQNLFE